MSDRNVQIVILGAGPAGLGAAMRLARRKRFDVCVIERHDRVGGNAGSFEVDGLRVDYGSHRLHRTCAPVVLDDIQELVGDDLLDRPRHGRILLRGRWVHFPLKPFNAARNLPASFLLGVLRDTCRNGHSNGCHEESFATVLQRGLGRTICRDFYFPYAEKIWGLPPDALDAEQARRRVSANSVRKMIRRMVNVLPRKGAIPKGRFYYPRKGFGQISDAYGRAARDAGVALQLRTDVSEVRCEQGRAVAVAVRSGESVTEHPASMVLSTIPLPRLVQLIRPSAPAEVSASVDAMQYRAMILIYLVLETDRFTEYDAHYFPGEDIPLTRLSEPKNYSDTVLDGRTVLCAELPCSTDDAVWTVSDERLQAITEEGLARAGLPVRVPVRRIVTRRLSHAYPIYTRDYGRHFDRLDSWVAGMDGLVTFGRQGLFAHDNTHHTLAMAYCASDCIGDDGSFDRRRWAGHRREFDTHVVED